MDILMTSPRQSLSSVLSHSQSIDDQRTIRNNSIGDLTSSSPPEPPNSDSSSDNDNSDDEDMEADERAEAVVAKLNTDVEEKVPVSATIVRILALLCACSLSIGSH